MGFRGPQRAYKVNRAFRGLQGVPRTLRGLTGVQRAVRGVQVVQRVLRRLTGGQNDP